MEKAEELCFAKWILPRNVDDYSRRRVVLCLLLDPLPRLSEVFRVLGFLGGQQTRNLKTGSKSVKSVSTWR